MNIPHVYESFNEAYLDLIHRVYDYGKIVAPRPGSSLGATRELLGADFTIPATMPLCTLKQRKMSYAFALLEPFYLFTHQDESDIPGALMHYAPNLKSLALNDKTLRFDGNYGDRINLRPALKTRISPYPAVLSSAESQMVRAYNVLKADPSSRRAVVTIHNPVWDVIDGESKDIPCTLSLQFLLREGRLHCFCTMRSNDIWFGTPHNVMMFTFLQRALAGWLGVAPGKYHHRANSMHLYEAHADLAVAVYKNQERNDLPEEVTYPRHPDHQYSLRRFHEIRQEEKLIRTGTGARAAEPLEPYEALTLQTLEEHRIRREGRVK